MIKRWIGVNLYIILIAILLLGIVLINGCAYVLPDGRISGRVTPAEAGIVVQAIQNLSLIRETATNKDGYYEISGLKPGKYGLLFIHDGKVYIYNDYINSNWFDYEKITVNETVRPNSVINFNFDQEWPDYISNIVAVAFESNITEEKVNIFIQSNNYSLGWYNGKLYEFRVPKFQTVLGIPAALESDLNIKMVSPITIFGTVQRKEEIQRCMDNYKGFFDRYPSTSNTIFEVSFKKSFSKVDIDRFLKEEVKTDFQYRNEFRYIYKYLIFTTSNNSLEVICKIEQSPYTEGVSLIGSGGSVANE